MKIMKKTNNSKYSLRNRMIKYGIEMTDHDDCMY